MAEKEFSLNQSIIGEEGRNSENKLGPEEPTVSHSLTSIE